MHPFDYIKLIIIRKYTDRELKWKSWEAKKYFTPSRSLPQHLLFPILYKLMDTLIMWWANISSWSQQRLSSHWLQGQEKEPGSRDSNDQENVSVFLLHTSTVRQKWPGISGPKCSWMEIKTIRSSCEKNHL